MKKKKTILCEICNKKIDGKIILKSPDLLNEDGAVHEFKLCSNCLGLWAGQDYEELTKRLGLKNGRKN